MIGVVADDITGANDIGAFFAAAGYDTYVYPTGTFHALPGASPDVAILDTNSRYLPPDVAAARVTVAADSLIAAGCERYSKKTCSVFRGNVGPEFDALLDALGRDFMIVVAGYPRNNRTTLHRIQYVFGRPLAESHFRNDPVHPTTVSDIVQVLQRQTPRTVAHVDIDLIRCGEQALRKHIAMMKARCQYLLFDAPDQEALRTIALAAREETVFGGSAGIAEELAPLWGPPGPPEPQPEVPAAEGLGIPCVVGSLTPVTAGQVKQMTQAGAPRLDLDPPSALVEAARELEVERLATEAAAHLRAGRDTLIMSPSGPERVEEAFDTGRALGLSEAEVGQRLSDALGEAAAEAMRRSGQNRALVAGGDTSAALVARLGLRAIRIGAPVEPGLPLCTGLGHAPVRLVLKGGSMGGPDFFARALAALRGPVPTNHHGDTEAQRLQ